MKGHENLLAPRRQERQVRNIFPLRPLRQDMLSVFTRVTSLKQVMMKYS